jgi:hypothetical protein
VDEKAGTLVTLSSANNNNSSVATVVTAAQQQGSGGGPTSLGFIDEETTTDWQPEIPFENVCGKLSPLHVTFETPAYYASSLYGIEVAVGRVYVEVRWIDVAVRRSYITIR